MIFVCYVGTLYRILSYFFFLFKQKTAYEMRISDWSSDVCSSDLLGRLFAVLGLLFEVIGRYPQHLQTVAFIALIQCLETFELRGETAEAGSVDHHQRLAGETLAQIDVFLGP